MSQRAAKNEGRDQLAKATLRLVPECGADHVTRADAVKSTGITCAAMVSIAPRGVTREILRDGVRNGQLPPDLDPEGPRAGSPRRFTVSWSLDARSDDVIGEAWVRLDVLVGGAARQRAIAVAGAAARANAKGS